MKRPNHALQLTPKVFASRQATRHVTTFAMAKTLPLYLTLGVGSRS